MELPDYNGGVPSPEVIDQMVNNPNAPKELLIDAFAAILVEIFLEEKRQERAKAKRHKPDA